MVKSKTELRKNFLEKRKNLTAFEYHKLNGSILKQVENIIPTRTQRIHIFYGAKQKKEIYTLPIIELLIERKHEVFLPRVKNFKKENDHLRCMMTHHKYVLTDKLVKNNLGIMEPLASSPTVSENTFDMVICPLLCFDNFGHRVGYGGGCYDNFLCKCRENTSFVGLSFFPPIKTNISAMSNDISIQYCITPQKIFTF